MPTNKTKNIASYSSKTKTAEEKIVHLCSLFVSEACGKILNSPKLTKADFLATSYAPRYVDPDSPTNGFRRVSSVHM